MMALSLFIRKGRTAMQKLNRRSLLLVGFTLFSMFFGAGNLIFPPYLGAQAGTVAAGLCRLCGQCDRSAGYWRDRCRACRWAVRVGRVHPRFAKYSRCWCTCRSARVWPSRARRVHRSKCSRRSLEEMQCGS
ncbi:MAG: branched-chain amino acid transport system II carrier protein [Butyricicoccus sp.]